MLLRTILLLILTLFLSSCGLVKAFIPDQDLGNQVLRVDSQKVPLQTERRKVLPASSLDSQNTDADCAATLVLPAGCEIVAVTPADKNLSFKFNDQQNDIPDGLEPNVVVTHLGLKPELVVLVPITTDEATLPQKMTLTQYQVTLKLFDADLKADEVAVATPDLEKIVNSEADTKIVFSRTQDACTAASVEGLKQCTYTTTDVTEDTLELRFTEITKLLKIIAKGKGKSAINTLTGSVELHFPELQGGNLPTENVFMAVKLDEGKSIAKF